MWLCKKKSCEKSKLISFTQDKAKDWIELKRQDLFVTTWKTIFIGFIETGRKKGNLSFFFSFLLRSKKERKELVLLILVWFKKFVRKLVWYKLSFSLQKFIFASNLETFFLLS